MRKSIHRRLLSIVLVALLIVVLIPIAVMAAGGQFVDDDSSIFESDIEWLAAANVTKGCNPPTNDRFCPDAAVTRGQMAAFMHRLADNRVVDAGSLGGIDSTGFVQTDELRYFSLLAETMQPVDSTIGYDNTQALLTTTSVSSLNGSATYVGQVDLPHGTTIQRVIAHGFDGSATEEYTFALFRYSLFDTPVWTQTTDFRRSGIPWNGGNLVSELLPYPAMAQVDNLNYSYGVFVELPADMSLGVLRFVVETN
ncbi:MAG: S-layer homology domain-containing protein [bacterium]|nr:S-layer homology domain-containing protein [bacterium]